MSGFFLLHRGWRDNPIFRGEFSRADAWVWLIENACWQPGRVRIKGETVTLERGELTFSQRFLAEKWGWSKSRVDRFIADLRDEGMIETRSKIGATAGHKAGQGQSIISICNYAKYQDVGAGQRGNDDDASGATAGQQRGNSGAKKNKETREQGDIEPIGSTSLWGAHELAHDPEPAKPARAKRTRSTGVDTPLPDDWQPNLGPAAQRIVAQWPPGMLEREAFAFRNHAVSKGRLARNWDGAFGTWIAKAEERRTTNAQPYHTGNHQPRDNRDGFERALDRRLERAAAQQPPRTHDARAGDGAGATLPLGLPGPANPGW